MVQRRHGADRAVFFLGVIMGKLQEIITETDTQYQDRLLQEQAAVDAALQAVDAALQVENYEHDEYAELFAGLGDNSEEKVLLYRIATGSQKQGLLCRLDPGASVEDIPPRFGGGDYVIKRLRGGMIMKSARLFVEGDPKIEQPVKPEATPVAPQLDMQALLQVMMESNKQLLSGLASVMVKPEPIPLPSRTQMLEEMAMMREIFTPANANSQTQQSGGMELFIKGIELASTLAPRTGETSGMDVLLESIKSFAPAIGEVVKQSTAARTVPTQKPKQQAIGAPATTPQPVAEIAVKPVENEDVMLFKYYVNMLVGFAKQGKDPALYADLIADNLSDEKIMSMLNNPNILNEMAAINSGVIDHRGWFEAVILELRVIMGLTEPVSINTVASPVIQIPSDNALQSTDGNHHNAT